MKTRSIKAETVDNLHSICELIGSGENGKAARLLSRLADDLSSSSVSIDCEIAPSSNGLDIPACRNTEDLIALNID